MYIDKHLHLSGACSQVVLYELLRESGLKLKTDYQAFHQTTLMSRDKVKSLDEYLAVLHYIDEVQSSPRAIEICAYDAYKTSFLDGASELQLRWNPTKRSLNQKIDLDSLIIAARAGMERAKNYFGISGSMILCLGRDCTPEANEALFTKALKFYNKGVIGIDVAGSEKLALQPEFERYYYTARKFGMVTTIHTGETDHPGVEDEMAYVLEKLQPARIGHGIQIVRFPSLMKKAAALGVEFELCMTSNVMTQSVQSYDDFAEIFQRFSDYGIRWSINTDATHTLGTTITKENHLFEQLKKL